MVAEPVATPVTSPDVLTVAMPVASLLHVPPTVASVYVELAPTHIGLVPLIEATVGKPLTVTAVVTEVVPQLFVTE